MNIKKSIILRVRVVFIVICLVGTVVVVRIGQIQYLEGSKWRKVANDMALRYKTVPATRGNIYSDNGSLLATSLPLYRVAFDPTVSDDLLFNKGIDSLAYYLSKFFKDRGKEYYKRRIIDARQSKREYMILSHDLIDYQEKKVLAEWPIFREGRLSGGIIFEKTNRRITPFSYLGYRTIGFINDNNVGAGLEYSFNKYLAGQPGKSLYRKVAGGRWRPEYDGTEIRPKDGYDIQTTLDVNLQDVTESALLGALKQHDASYGCVVVMEVKTGEIKAISNLRKNKNNNGYREVYNYAVQGLHDPGSTFKLASMIALLEDSNVKLSDSIDTGDGAFKFYDVEMQDHKPGGYGKISVREAFEVSSNIAISKMVYNHFGSNPQRFIDYLKEMRLDQPLGFQLIGEGIPKIKDADDPSWSGISLPWMSIGYEIELTPLQILAFYNAIANDGELIQPILVKEVKKADRTIEEFETEILKEQICSESTLKEVKSLLEGVVERGTASNIRNAHYKIAGKTGTAQVIRNGRYTKRYYTSFVGYFPADKPMYSCIVVINEPKGVFQYGASVAAPVFKEIADMVYAQNIDIHDPYEFMPPEKGIFPVIQAGNKNDLNLICKELGISAKNKTTEEWVRAHRKDNAVLWTTNGIAPGVVPNVLGMTLRDAIFLLENQGLKVNFRGEGRVVDQSQLPGKKVIKGSTINLSLS